MKQQSFFKPGRYVKEYGGALSIKKRRSRRPLSTKEPLHLTLRSDYAHKSRSLLRHRPLIEKVIKKASQRFHIRIFEKAICGNHIHLLVYGRHRENLQNFFRVVAGHIAQGILRECPVTASETKADSAAGGCAPGGVSKGHPKNRRKFWALLLYSRVLTWGREYKTVRSYIVQNILEALNIIAYRPRKSRHQRHSNSS